MTLKQRIQETKISISWFAKVIDVPISSLHRHLNEDDVWYMQSEKSNKLIKLIERIEQALDI